MGLKRRYLIAMGAVSGAIVLVAAALLYAHATGRLSDRGLSLAVLATAGVGLLGAVGLIAALAESYVRPLRAVIAVLNGAARGDYETAADVGRANELKELADAVESMRTSLRSSTISRDYLDRLLASMAEALLITDGSGRIERANAAAAELFGYSESELVGKLADELITSSDRRRADATPTRPRDGAVQRPDGSTISISYTVAYVRNDRNEIESKVYAARDVDERRRVEQRIRYLARTDPLTKLANRMQFQHLLQQ